MSTRFWVFVYLMGMATLVGCRKDDYYTGSDVDIRFSQDTLRFDTVFTTIGSATRSITVHNKGSKPVLADISLRRQANDFFRINVDGSRGPRVSDVEIGAGDSIYVFVEVTIDPDQPWSISPFVIEDFIDVECNGKQFEAHLEAWGQNANYITPSSGKGNFFLYQCDLGEETWDDPRPYVIYGILYVDSCRIVLPAGTRVYVHGGVVRDSTSIYNDGLLVFLRNGSLDSRGTPENPVVIQGDRLEKEFEDVSSQWVGLLFWQQSRNNKLSHTVIRNSIIGMQADSLAQVNMSGCIIHNTGGPAVRGRHASVSADNCLFFDNGSNAIQLIYGGKYRFDFCTVASYSGQNEALAMTNFYCPDPPLCLAGIRINPLDATFTNCILTGSDSDEIAFGLRGEETSFKYRFDHCAFRIDELDDDKNFPNFSENTNACLFLKASDRMFLDRSKNDFRLDTMSVALSKGVKVPGFPSDLLGKLRKDPPDLGCFEF